MRARRRWLAALAVPVVLALAGCAGTTPGGLPVVTTQLSRSHDSRALFLVLHFTQADMGRALQLLTSGDVSAHYLVSDETPPRIFRLVDEDRRAWHAGLSAWRGHRMLNASSIGIEIVHPGLIPQADGSVVWPPYREDQLALTIRLVQDIVARHQIRPERVVAHSDIAPQRKVDPGPRFPWKRLADLGLVPWPDAGRVAERRQAFERQLPEVAWFQEALARHGFEVERHGRLDEPTRKVLQAFQMKYRPENFDGTPDAETAALLDVLLAQEGRR